jgi:hypothetical protein
MSFILLNLHDSERTEELDPDQAIRRLQDWFPGATVLPGDQLARSVEHAESFFGGPTGNRVGDAEKRVVESLRRKSILYGPALAFQIPVDSVRAIRGSARCVDITFNFDDPLPDPIRDRVIEHLKTFGAGRIEHSSADGKTTELIFDNGTAK